MSALVFVDTNVLLYAVDSGDRSKHAAARVWRAELWRRRCGRLSFQVLHEFYAQVLRKNPSAREQARAEIRDLQAWSPVATSQQALEAAWDLQDRYKLPFWDALIVAAARLAACSHLLSEDFQAGQDLGGVLVVSPFQSEPDSVLGPAR
jgi:predicted nucleic acid-binding protein